MTKKTVNQTLKSVRKFLNRTQTEFADDLMMTRPHYTNIETGVQPLLDRHIELIAIKHNVNPEYLRTGKGDMFTNEPVKDDQPPSETQIIADRLRKARELVGETQESFAESLGMTRQNYGLIEKCKQPLLDRHIGLMQLKYKISPDYIKSGTKPELVTGNQNIMYKLETSDENQTSKYSQAIGGDVEGVIPFYENMDEEQPDRHWKVPDWPTAERITPMRGRSMDKIIYPGAPLVLVKIDHEDYSNGIMDFGKPHLIRTKSLELVKMVHISKEKGCIHLANNSSVISSSDNFDMPISLIKECYQIKVCANEF